MTVPALRQKKHPHIAQSSAALFAFMATFYSVYTIISHHLRHMM
jgi:hypothetical protein